MMKILLTLLAAVVLGATASKTSQRWSPFGIVEGIKDCGSKGQLGRVEVTDCTLVPCHFIPNTIYDVAVRFTASISSDSLALIVYRMVEGGPPVPLMELPITGLIEANIEYELKFQLPVSTELAGTGFDIRFYVLDVVSSYWEVCAEASVTVGPA